MIFDLIQTRSTLGADYVYTTKENQMLYTANIRLAIAKININLLKNNEIVLSSTYGISDRLNNLKKSFLGSEYSVLKIQKPNDEVCGKICYKRVRKFFFGYGYYEIDYDGELFTCYTVGRGKEGIFICIYIGDRQVAMIEKPPIVRDNKDRYIIYTIDNKYNDIVSFFGLYYDHYTSSNYTQYAYKKTKVSYVYSLNKEIKSKYNPKFKELC